MHQPRERNTHRTILQRARDRGAYAVTQSSPPADTGTPDHLWCLHAWFLGVELKPGGAKDLDDVQKARGVEIIRAGGIFVVLRQVADVDVLAAVLADERRRRDIWPGHLPARPFSMWLATPNPERPITR